MNKYVSNTVFLLVVITFAFFSCVKPEEKLASTGALEFSTDTVFFDTVFTTITTVTKRLRVYNKNSNAVQISSISIPTTTPFSLIINGIESNNVRNLILNGKDSLLILINAKLGDNNSSNPLLFEQPITFITNEVKQNVVLSAVGRDVYLHKNDSICNVTWSSDKPHLVYGYVRVPNGCTLTIEPGTEVYFHGGSYFFIEGTLIVNGTDAEHVIFTDNRLESYYNDIPGMWDGVYFLEGSVNNNINWLELTNAVNGFYCYTPDIDSTFNLSIYNSIIHTIGGNSLIPSVTNGFQGYGLVAFKSDVYAENTLITNCLTNSVACLVGDKYEFVNCTFANYDFMFSRNEDSRTFVAGPILYDGIGQVIDAAETKVSLINSIIWGNNSNEFSLGSSNAQYPLQFGVANSIIRTQEFKSQLLPVLGNLINANPLFLEKYVDSARYDFNLVESGSPAVNSGIGIAYKHFNSDLNGLNKRDAQPDLGAYEFKD